jgi:M6 family metalloprotease-like protein
MPNPDFIGDEEIRGRYNGNATAFPFGPTVLPTEGKLKAVMVMVDWEDLQGDEQEYEFYKKNAELTEQFWLMASEGKLELEIELTDEFLRIPGSYSDFAMTQEEEGQRYQTRPKKQQLYDAIVEVSDSLIDYTDIQIVFPAWPRGKTISERGPHEFNFDWNAAMYTEERDIYDIAGAGNWHLNHTEFSEGPWVYYVHEMGHMLGIPHQTHTGQLYRDGTFTRQESWWKENPINGFEIMANQDGAVKTLTAWLRWLPGWLDDDQVVCLTEDSIEDEIFALTPINEVGGDTEAVIVRLSDTKVVVIESRRWDERFDRPIVHSRDGIIAYTVDSTMSSGEGNQALLSPRDITKFLEVMHWRHSEEMDGNFCQGDSVDIANIRITAEHIGEEIDHVRITKTDTYVDPNTPAAGSTETSVNTIENDCVYGPGADWQYWQREGLVSSFSPSGDEITQYLPAFGSARNFRGKSSCSCCGCAPLS